MMNCMAFSMVMPIINAAFRSDCSSARPWLVFVVAKKVRAGLTMMSGSAWRAGLEGLKPKSFVAPRHG